MTEQARSRRKLLLIAAMFLAPFLAAYALYYLWPSLIPEDRTNYGTLVSPARALPALTLADAAGAPAAKLTGKWTLLYLGGATCGEPCRQRVYLVRQVRLALAKDRTRVQRVYLAPGAAALAAGQAALSVADEHDLVFVSEAEGKAAGFFQPTDPNAIYLLDPLGNWLMVYTGDIEPKKLLKDLKKLLLYSQVG